MFKRATRKNQTIRSCRSNASFCMQYVLLIVSCDFDMVIQFLSELKTNQ